MSDPTIGVIDLAKIEEEEHREKIHNRILIGTILFLLILGSLAVGAMLTDSQDTASQARQDTEQAQIEKFNLAQQIKAACEDPATEALDESTYARLCTDARTIVREGPQGAQGIPGTQGVPGMTGADGPPGPQGAQGKPGKDGADGNDGGPGPAGADGAAGADGNDGAAGEPPFSWIVYDQQGDVSLTCSRAADFSAASPSYACTPQ